MDTAFAESGYAADSNIGLGPDDAFDRQWAITLNNLTLERLEQEFAASGKAADFSVLKECLAAARGAIDYASIAARLSIADGAARVAVHRLRKRFREIYREEISRTLSDDSNLEEELHHLAQALARA
jgi:RNA polymerase sigma-70 factor (ECF subfamily)